MFDPKLSVRLSVCYQLRVKTTDRIFMIILWETQTCTQGKTHYSLKVWIQIKMVWWHSGLERLYTVRDCQTGTGQEEMKKNQWSKWLTWAMSCNEWTSNSVFSKASCENEVTCGVVRRLIKVLNPAQNSLAKLGDVFLTGRWRSKDVQCAILQRSLDLLTLGQIHLTRLSHHTNTNRTFNTTTTTTNTTTTVLQKCCCCY